MCGYSRRSFARGHYRELSTKSHRIWTNSKLKVQAHVAVSARGTCIYTFHNSRCIYHEQKTAALGCTRNSINSLPLVENGGGEATLRWMEEEERGRIDTSEIYFWGKKNRANCYAIKSRAAGRDPRNSRSFAFNLKRPNFVDADVSVIVLLLPTSPRPAKNRVNEGLISRQRSKKVYVALKFMTSHKQKTSGEFFPKLCDSSKGS